MSTNRPGPGSHVATASFMVDRANRRTGVGTALCSYALSRAREQGYAGMQFNAVAESNLRAVALYERLGFAVMEPLPERSGIRHCAASACTSCTASSDRRTGDRS